jgi:N-acetylmuramoyl-L-alanine amidase
MYKVIIDPGHSGWKEPGAVHQSLTEAMIVLEIGKHVREQLTYIFIECLLTRSGSIDTDDLAFRAKVANDEQADLFVSIHCNSFESETANGVEVFHYPDSEMGQAAAGCIQNALVKETGMRDRGVKPANFYVLKHTDCPAVLVECGFLSNPSDRRILAASNGRQRIARAITVGIMCYCQAIQSKCAK